MESKEDSQMARTVAGLPEGLRLTDHISLGVITKTFPMARVKEILREHGRVIRRKLPQFVAISPSGPRRVPPSRSR